MIAKIIHAINFKQERLHLHELLLLGVVCVARLRPKFTEFYHIWHP